jgi:hypothetical protein
MRTTKGQAESRIWIRLSLLVVVTLIVARGGNWAPVLADDDSSATIEWRAEYYANRDLAGQPALVRTDRNPAATDASSAEASGSVGLDLNWEYGAPAEGLPADDFSARWTGQATFAEGNYRFLVTVDDGVRLYVDGVLIVDEWREGARRERTAERWLSAGAHSLRVEYFERSGVALIGVWWERAIVYADWKGEYWANPTLEGRPALTRNDVAPEFDWGYGAPGTGLPVDNFSARWTRIVTFDQGTYRFHAVVDDGGRLYVDGAVVIDEWREGGRRERIAERWLAAGEHSLRVEYYERGGEAAVSVWWEEAVSHSDWVGEYWENRNLDGDPRITRSVPSSVPDGGLDLYWGYNAPSSKIPKDGFSARWTRRVSFEGGTYRFRVAADDGARLYLDDEPILDEWREGARREWTADRPLSAGEHTLRLEYFEVGGEALVSLRWENLSTYPAWKGEYWPNRDLEGTPALVRNDPAVNFNWEMGSPGGAIPADGFSARWTRRLYFDAGLYRFTAWVDDGVRVWVGDQRVIDAWTDHSLHQVTGEVRLGQGVHTVTIDYYDSVFEAQISVGWERTAGESYSEWKGEYWANRTLSGEPALVRNDRDLDFSWEERAPAAGLPLDNFSARWTREVRFDEDVYRFYVHADDGVKVYIDDKKVLDEWHSSEGEIYSFTRRMDGEHDLEVRFYEGVGDARLRFWWTRLRDLRLLP